MRTARIVVVATAIGATAGAGVVFTLAGSGNNPGQQAIDAGKSLVVVRSLVQPAEAATAATEPRVAPVATTAPVATPAVMPQPLQANAQPSQANTQPKGSLTLPPPAAQISGPASSESRAASTSAVPASVAALAEIPPVTDAAPVSSASQALFTPDQTGAGKLGGKPAAASPISQPSAALTQGPQAPAAQTPAHAQPTAVASAKKKPDEHGLGPMLRHLFSARAGNSYSSN
jgi:ribonuclease E